MEKSIQARFIAEVVPRLQKYWSEGAWIGCVFRAVGETEKLHAHFIAAAWEPPVATFFPFTMRQGIFPGASDRSVGDYMGIAVSSRDPSRMNGTTSFIPVSTFLQAATVSGAAAEIVANTITVTPSAAVPFHGPSCP